MRFALQLEFIMEFPAYAAKLALTDDKLFERLVKQADIASASALDDLPPVRPRFEVVFRNGVWVLRDYRYWYHSAGPFPTCRAANKYLEKP